MEDLKNIKIDLVNKFCKFNKNININLNDREFFMYYNL